MAKPVELIQRALPFNEWPAADQQLWNKAIQDGDLFTDAGMAAHWRPTTRKTYTYSYGRWLRFINCRYPALLAQSPADRLAREIVLSYVELLKEQQLNPTTIWGYVNELNNVAYRLMPGTNWAWLRQIANRLHLVVRPRPNLESQLVPVQSLFELGIDLMKQSKSKKPRRSSSIHVDYRDGLMIALLASMPVRLQNFGNIIIDQHLKKTPGGYLLIFPEEEVKNRQHIEVEIYEPLIPLIEHYLAHHRPRLLGEGKTDYLWVSKIGKCLKPNHVSERITRVTQRELGKPITPHMFRHCAATSIAETSPELARIIRPLLAHTTTATSEIYYNRASVLKASQSHISTIQSIRESISKLNLEEVA
ncbi:MAG: tyrosine-type recombinase/integrase [Rhodospirillaceae bacterium]|jgi:integrase/recombinase XerD|nr:tyrosine-type recombinase/integrase [Rhodospirillaceae bacterium]